MRMPRSLLRLVVSVCLVSFIACRDEPKQGEWYERIKTRTRHQIQSILPASFELEQFNKRFEKRLKRGREEAVRLLSRKYKSLDEITKTKLQILQTELKGGKEISIDDLEEMQAALEKDKSLAKIRKLELQLSLSGLIVLIGHQRILQRYVREKKHLFYLSDYYWYFIIDDQPLTTAFDAEDIKRDFIKIN